MDPCFQATDTDENSGLPILSLEDIHTEIMRCIEGLLEGEPLDSLTAAFIAFGVRASVTVLDPAGMDYWIDKSLELGATGAQVQDIIVLVSGLGVHSLMEGSTRLMRQLRARRPNEMNAPVDARRQELWARYVGDDPYWKSLEREMPGFLDSLLRLSPDAFEGFFQYCGLPWRSRALPAVTKELIAFACDATRTHRFLPGLRLHLDNAIALGAGRAAILQALEIAAAAPTHSGVH